MHRKFGLLSPGKVSSHSTALPSFFSLCVVFLFFHTTDCEAYSFTIDGYGIFNASTNLGAHEGGVRHKQVYTRVDSEGQKKGFCSSPCSARGSNPGSSDLVNPSDALATEPRPLVKAPGSVTQHNTIQHKT